MLITASLAFLVLWKTWKWSPWAAGLAILPFAAVEFLFLLSNMLKVLEGGYVPLLFAGALVVMMWTWVRGVGILINKTRKTDVPLTELVGMLEKSPPHHVRGTAVFLTSDPYIAPAALLHNLKHNKVLHEKNLFVTVRHHEVPWIASDRRCEMKALGHDCWEVTLNFGFKNEPDVPKALIQLRQHGCMVEDMETSYFLSRDIVIPTIGGGMADWREKIFAGMHRNAAAAADFLRLPTTRVVELGSKVEI
jgi:KUP system potassium uptake protein